VRSKGWRKVVWLQKEQLADGQHRFRPKAQGVQVAAQFLHQRHKSRREVMGFLGPAVGGLRFRAGLFARFAHGGHFFKAHRQPPGGALAILLVEGRQERSLQEALPPEQVGPEGRALGVAAPEGVGNLFARFFEPGVVQADGDRAGAIARNRPL
jgi:hypothetical protein